MQKLPARIFSRFGSKTEVIYILPDICRGAYVGASASMSTSPTSAEPAAVCCDNGGDTSSFAGASTWQLSPLSLLPVLVLPYFPDTDSSTAARDFSISSATASCAGEIGTQQNPRVRPKRTPHKSAWFQSLWVRLWRARAGRQSGRAGRALMVPNSTNSTRPIVVKTMKRDTSSARQWPYQRSE